MKLGGEKTTWKRACEMGRNGICWEKEERKIGRGKKCKRGVFVNDLAGNDGEKTG
jgi:hypothetical protein